VQRIVNEGEAAYRASVESLAHEAEEPEPDDTSYDRACKILDSIERGQLDLLRLVLSTTTSYGRPTRGIS
jgi:hypothetical protein